MQKFLLNLASFGLLTTVLFFSSCDPDPVVTNPLGPAIQFVSDTDILSGDSEVTVGENFTVRIKVDKGDNPLNSIEIQEDGVKLNADRILSINGGAISSGNNPFLITGTDKDGATFDITLSQGAHVEGDVVLYNFIVTDDQGANAQSANKDIQITTAAIPGTPLSMSVSGILLNQAGPTGTGGLDLDLGNGTGSADATAEIRDLGLDCTISAGTENWRAQMGTVNGADMVKVDPTQLENFTFDNVDKKEPILDAYNTGVALADGESVSCTSGTGTAVTDVTDVVAVGDMFVVSANSNYYLIRVDAVTPVADSNADQYDLSIKY